jgi:hypothetical protein
MGNVRLRQQRRARARPKSRVMSEVIQVDMGPSDGADRAMVNPSVISMEIAERSRGLTIRAGTASRYCEVVKHEDQHVGRARWSSCFALVMGTYAGTREGEGVLWVLTRKLLDQPKNIIIVDQSNWLITD